MYLQKVLYQCSHVRLDRELFFSKSYLEFLSTKVSHRKRPSTLMLDKKERLKRSSNVSTTPSTDSSKSSKTFEFLEDYDEETKEKVLSNFFTETKDHESQVLEEAIKEEDSFLEYVKTLKIEVTSAYYANVTTIIIFFIFIIVIIIFIFIIFKNFPGGSHC